MSNSFMDLVERRKKELGLRTSTTKTTPKTSSSDSKNTIGSRNAADGSSGNSFMDLVERRRKELGIPSRNETETKPERNGGLTSEQRRAALMIDLEESRRAESDAIRRFESVGDNDEDIKMLGQIASEAAERRKAIENQLKELDFEDKYSTKTYDDNFFGQAAASFTVGNLSEKSNKAWYDYLQDPSEENRWRKDMIDTALQKFQTNNEATLADDAALPWVSQSLAGYLPQLGRQIGYSAAGGAMGAAAGSAIPVIGTGLGLKAGITAGSGLYSYQTMRGAAFRELVNAGMDEETAMKASADEAVLSAIIEMGDTAFDIATLGGGTLIKNLLSEGAEAAMKNSGKKRLLKALGGYGLNIAGEMGEEGAQQAVSIANRDRDDTGLLDLTGKSINTLWEAAHNTDSDNWKEIWGAAKEGGKIAAMMGGAQGAVNFAANEAVTRQRGSAVNAEGDVSVQQLIEMALETEEGTESREMAEQMQTRYAAGENFSNREVGKLYNATVDSVSGGRVIRQESTEQAPQQTAEQISDGHSELAKAAMEMAGIETEERTTTAEVSSITPNNAAVTPNNTTPVVNNASRNVRNATETTNNATETTNNATETTNNATADPIAQKAASVRKLTEEFVSLSTGYGEHGSRAVMEVMESENLTAPEARRMVETSYELGYRNQTVDTTRLNDVQMKAYEAGKLDAAAQGQRNVATAAASAVHQGGIDTSHKDSDNLYVTRLKNTQPKVYAAVDKLGKATGTRIVFDKSLRGGMSNGSYISSTGEIHIAPDAQNPIMQVVRHEVTHRMKDTAPGAYAAFREEALQVMGEGAVERMKAQYLRDSDGKVRLTTEGAMDEIAALYAEKILTDDKELGNFIEKGKQNTKNRSMVQKFFDAIHNFVAKIKSMLNDDKASQDAAAMKEFGVTIDQLERAEQLWKDALAESEQNVKAKRQGIETSAQQEYNGSNETQYALKYWKPDLNKTEWSIVNSVMQGYHSNKTWDVGEIVYGFHVKSKGEEVFGYVSTDDNTLLYASGGDNAVADARAEEAYGRYWYETNRDRKSLDRHIEELRNRKKADIGNRRNAEERRAKVGDDRLSATVSENRKRDSDQGRNHGRSEADHESEVSQYSLKGAELQTAINQSMTMEQCKDMIQRAFILGEVKKWHNGKYKNGDEWAHGEGAEDVALIVDNEWSLQEKFLNKIEGVMEGDFYAEDIIEAYLAGTLTGKQKMNTTKRLDLAQGSTALDNRFYAPKQIENAKTTYEVAIQKVTNKNRDEVTKARADIIMFAHTRGAAEALGLTQSELNKKLSQWARYTARAREVAEKFNAGVADWNKWTGIENSNLLKKATVSNEDLDRLVGNIEGDSDGWQRKYIMRTMLALDTHIDYTGLNFKFVGQPDPNNRNVNGLYSNGERTITVKRNAPHTVAHEMGHYLDYQWARDVGVGGALTERIGRNTITDPDVKQWVTNFDNFKETLEDVAALNSGYTMDSKEVFARFVDRFVVWVNFTANGEQDTSLRYNDKFTAKHYIEFVKLLQEKAALDSKQHETTDGAQFSLKSKPTAPTFYSHMARVIDGVKQEKLGAASVVPMLRGKGVKAEEIKWSGIEAFLEGKKSVTKQELQEFAEGSMLEIEEQVRGGTNAEAVEGKITVDYSYTQFGEVGDTAFVYRDGKLIAKLEYYDWGDYWITEDGEYSFEDEDEIIYHFSAGDVSDTKWHEYKLEGGENYRELLFKMPDSDYSNKAMKAHWDDTNGVLAHARVQDFDTADGKMLFVEEIQSDWHNEGHKQGYGNDTASDIYDRIAAHNRKVDTDPKLYAIAGKLIPNIIENNKRFGIEISEDTARQYAGNAILSHRGDAKEFANIKGIKLTSDEMVALDSFIDGKKSLDRERATAIVRKPVPDAPFRDTYHEFVMKRLIREAAEKGYNSIGWTTADIQSDRWSDEYAEGYRIEYDQDIPKFLRKYGKKWGAKVGKTEIQTKHLTKDQEAKLYKLAEILEEGEEYIREGKGIVEVWSMPITDDMWESVLHEGQPMYSLRNQSDIVKDSADRRAVNTALRRAYKNGEIVVMDKPSLHRLTKRMMDSVGSKADTKDMEARVTELYEYIINGENGDRGEFNTAYELAYAIGVELADSAVAVEQDDYQDMKELRDVIRTTGITINKAYDHDLIGYESINEFRKANFGRIKLTKDGIPVDSFYQELATSFPGYFNESEYTTQPEQLMHIAEVLDGLKPTEYNPYEGNTAEAASWFANDLLMRIYGMQNERIADVIVRQKESAARAVKRESAKRAEAVKKVRTKYKDRDLRDRIERHATDLRHKLLRPSDKHHIPDEYRGLVLAVLDSINLESKYDYVYDADGKRTRVERATIVGAEMTKRTQAFSALKDRYAQLAEEGDMVVDPDLIGDAAYGPGKLDKIVAMGDVPIANMDSDQLQLIWDVIRSLEHGINNAGKTLSKAKYANTAAWAEAITLDTGSRRTKKGSTAERFRIDLENPLTFFSHYGEAGKAIFRMLRDAQDRQQQMVSEIKSEVQRIVDKNSVEKWERDIHTFTTDRGDNLTLSTAHIMEIYLLMKREQAQDHLLKGGIVQPEIEGILGKRKKINRGTDAVLLTFDDLAKIIKTLTKEQIQVADGLQQLTSSTLAEFGNEASMKAYGYRKFTGKDYWTIKSAQEGVHSNVEKGGNNTRSIKNIGLAKSVVPHANNPLDIGGVFKTFSSHAGDMIDYAAWLCPMEDANRLFNFKFKGTGKTMKGLLERYGGKGAQQYWSRLMEDIQNGLSATNDSEFLAPINKIIGNVKGASVGANIRVIVQQPTSILRAAVVLNPVNMTKGLAKGVTEGSGWQKALKYSAIAQRKDMGGFDISSPMQMSEILFDSKDKLQRFNELMMEGAAKADSVTWGRIWNACEWEIADTTELKAGTEEFYEAVAEKFTDVIDQSQVVDGVLQRSQTMRSGNAIMKQATSFMGEPTMVLNMMLRAYDAFVNTDGQERSEARKFFGRTAAVLAVTTTVNALAQSIVDGWRDDEEEEDYLERVGNAFVENLLQGLNPLGYIPIAKDVISMVNGYNVTRADADVMGDIITAFKGLADSFSADGKKTMFNASWNLIKQTSKVFGVSAGNIVRDVHGIVRSIANDNDNLEVLYFMERAIYKLNGKNQSRFFNILWRAYEQGDTDLYEKMVTDMIDNGIEYTSIQNGMQSRAKSAGIDASDLGDIDYLASLNLKNPTVKEEEEEFTVNDLADPLAYEHDYSRITMDIYGDFLLHGYHNLDAETQNKVLEAAHDYAHETALANHSGGQYQITEAWILEARRSGLDIGTYIMFNKQSSELSKMEKLDLMDDMNLRGDEYNALLEAAFFTATDKKKLDAAALGVDQYDDYTREFVGVYEDVESSLERSRSWNSYDKDAQDKMLDYAESFAREYALEQLSRGRYDSTTEFNYVTVDNVLGGIRAGLDEGEIFEAIYVKGTLPGIKDKNGNTVRDSVKDQFIAWMQKKGYSRNKQKAMLQAVGYSTRGF